MQPNNNNVESKSQKDGNEIELRRFNVTFDEEALELITKIAKDTDRKPVEVLSDALGFYDWAKSQIEEGKEVGSVKNGRVLSIAKLSSLRKKQHTLLQMVVNRLG